MNAPSGVAVAVLPSGPIELFGSAAYDRRYPPHFHETYSIGLIDTGQAEIRTMRGVEVAGPGSILVFAPGEVHAATPMTPNGYGYRMAYPTVELIHDLLGAPGRAPMRFKSAVVNDVSLASDIGRLLHACAGEMPSAEGHLASVARRLASEFADAGNPSSRRRDDDGDIVKRAKAFVDHRLGERVSLHDLSAECGTTQFRLIRIFQRVLGVTPHAYLLQARLNRARTMLARGMPIVNVAFDCGFSDQSHLTRAFRDAVGVPPGQYQRSVFQCAS